MKKKYDDDICKKYKEGYGMAREDIWLHSKEHCSFSYHFLVTFWGKININSKEWKYVHIDLFVNFSEAEVYMFRDGKVE